MTDDPRRDAVVLWLAANGVPAIADAATTVVRMVNATRGFGTEALVLLDAAQDALARRPVDGPLTRACGLADVGLDHPLGLLRYAVSAVDALISQPDFAEGLGHEAMLPLPFRTMHHYIAPDPAGCWALNLALVACGVVPGIVPRTVFRLDLNDTERSAALVDHSTQTVSAAFRALEDIGSALYRGSDALADLSRNSRAADAWALITALGSIRRIQIARGLSLSRAGADIQARALATAGLARVEPGGRVAPALPCKPSSSSATLDQGQLGAAAADVDIAMAEIDRLLSHNSDRRE